MAADPLAPKMGKTMMILCWVILLAGASWFFGFWEQQQINPNRDPQSSVKGGIAEVVLDSNRMGHYLSGGTINGKSVTFLVDTGATNVAIPGGVAQQLALDAGPAHRVRTANGTTEAYQTRIGRLSIGDVVLHDVSASIVPNMGGKQILLGMSVLRQIEFSHRGDTLTLRQQR